MKKGWIFLFFPLLVSGCSKNRDVAIPIESFESEQVTVQELSEKQSIVKEAEDDKGYIFVYKDIVIEIDSPADSVLEQLGDANSYFEAPT